MTTDDQIRDEKLQYHINGETTKIPASSSSKKKKKNGKYEYLTGEEILPFNQKKKIIEQAKFTYFPLGKGFEIQIKTVEDQQIMKLRL